MNNQFDSVTVALQQNILSFYNGYKPVLASKREKREWQETELALSQLKTMQIAGK